jgi:tRNA 2-thiouridine synthesizing protein A
MNTELQPNDTLDARGLLCPEPVMLLHNRVRDIAAGELLRVLATDPSTERDIARFCQFLGHELVSAETSGDEFHFLIRKGGGSSQ